MGSTCIEFRSRWRNGLARLQQWLCYLQGPGFKSHLQLVEFFLFCNKVSPLNNRTVTTLTSHALIIEAGAGSEAPYQKKYKTRFNIPPPTQTKSAKPILEPRATQKSPLVHLNAIV